MTTTARKTDRPGKPEAPFTNGRVVRSLGVVDVEFPHVPSPSCSMHCALRSPSVALAKALTLEVAQHLGDNLVRTISLQPCIGLVRGVG